MKEIIDRKKGIVALAKAITAIKDYREWKVESKAKLAYTTITGIVAESPRTGRWVLTMLKRMGYIDNPIKIDQFMILDVGEE